MAKLKGEETPLEATEPDWGADRLAMSGVAIASVLAILLSVVGFVRHEPTRIVGSAAVLGGTALALQYVVIAIGAIVVAIIIGAVLNGLDFGV